MKQQLHKTHGYGFDSSHAGWVNGDTILRGHTVEWGGGRASYRGRKKRRQKREEKKRGGGFEGNRSSEGEKFA